MRVCWFGTYERDYPRNRIAIDGLARHGVEVVECHVEVWGLTRIKLRDYFRAPSLVRLALRYLAALAVLTVRHARLPRYDVMVVGFNGHLDVPLAWLLTRLTRRPLVLDPLVSVYNTLVEDKRFCAPGSLAARAIAGVERWIYSLPDVVVTDTGAHRRYFAERFGVPHEKLVTIHTGADERVFHALGVRRAAGPLRVLYYGKYLPLHGVRTMFEASRLLAAEDVSFTFIGRGDFADEARAVYGAARTRDVPHVTLIEWVPYEELPKLIEGADVCLGIVGGTRKADLVMPNKAYQAFAMGKALVTGDSTAARELLGADPCAVLVPMADAHALADAIRALARDPLKRRWLGERAARAFRERWSVERIGARWLALVEALARGERALGHSERFAVEGEEVAGEALRREA